jgi:hypothetical protein
MTITRALSFHKEALSRAKNFRKSESELLDSRANGTRRHGRTPQVP